MISYLFAFHSGLGEVQIEWVTKTFGKVVNVAGLQLAPDAQWWINLETGERVDPPKDLPTPPKLDAVVPIIHVHNNQAH